jgi:Fe-S oxidoreductase
MVPTGSVEAAQPPRIPSEVAGKTVALFPGCMTDRLYPEQGMAIVRTMRALGVRMVYPGGLNCCGLPASNMGDDPTARKMAQQTIEALENALSRTQADYIVSGSASCVAMLTQDYLHIFRNELTWQARAEALAGKVMDFTSFLVNVARIPAGTLTSDSVTPVVTYHDSCQGLNALGLSEEPREILVDLLGCEVRELDGNRTCCGFGGSFSFDYPEIAERLMNRKLDNAQATDAPLVVTDNQGCIMHLRGGCDAEGRSLKVAHIAELVAARIDHFGPEPGARSPESGVERLVAATISKSRADSNLRPPVPGLRTKMGERPCHFASISSAPPANPYLGSSKATTSSMSRRPVVRRRWVRRYNFPNPISTPH